MKMMNRATAAAVVWSAAMAVGVLHATAPIAPEGTSGSRAGASAAARGAGSTAPAAARGGGPFSPLTPLVVGEGGMVDGVFWARGYDQAYGGVKPTLMNLWPPGKEPNPIPSAPPETNADGERFARVSVPGIFVYLPSTEKLQASGGAAILICTGGGYSHLTRVAGGDGTADEFVPKGIAIVSLKYRLQPPSTNPEADGVLAAMRAIRTMRANAGAWGIDPQKIGMMGWSAGGNLIVSLCTHLEKDGAGDPASGDPIERENCKPNFVVLWSPWPNGKPITIYTPAKDVKLPPAMIGGAEDDTTAPFPYVTSVKDMWLKAGGQAEFIVQPTGKHQSFELNIGEAKNWPEKLLPWMEKLAMWKSGK